MLVTQREQMIMSATWQGDMLAIGSVTTLGLITMGSYVYNYKVPECWSPGRYDLWGHSHQIWHVCVFLAPMCTFMSLLQWDPSTCPA